MVSFQKSSLVANHDINISADLKRMLMKLIVLKKISKKKVYAYSLLKELECMPNINFFFKDTKKIKNDLYNILKTLNNEGYIVETQSISNGRIRKYYALTQKGRKSVNEINEEFASAVKNIKKILNA
ncbi:MAG: PadR family transcriptional regulator [Candidatus Micrarchaeia archaeon]